MSANKQNQIYDLATFVELRMQSRQFPIEMVYGNERAARVGYFGNVVIVERDHDSNDTLSTTQGQHTNPKMRGIRGCAIKVTIFAKSSLEGATIAEHEFDCEQFVDAWLIAQQEWGTGSGAGYIPMTGARYVPAKERANPEQWPGVVYELKFVVPRAIKAVTYYEQARPVAQATGVGGSVLVKESGLGDETVPMP